LEVQPEQVGGSHGISSTVLGVPQILQVKEIIREPTREQRSAKAKKPGEPRRYSETR
jgi:hypothetical protein